MWLCITYWNTHKNIHLQVCVYRYEKASPFLNKSLYTHPFGEFSCLEIRPPFHGHLLTFSRNVPGTGRLSITNTEQKSTSAFWHGCFLWPRPCQNTHYSDKSSLVPATTAWADTFRFYMRGIPFGYQTVRKNLLNDLQWRKRFRTFTFHQRKWPQFSTLS